LRRFINCFDNCSHTIWVVRISCVISIQKPNSLLHMMNRLPKPNKIRHLWYIHQLYIIYMSIRLSIQHSTIRHTAITNTKRIRWMFRTTIFDFVVKLSWRSTMLTSLILSMLTVASFFFHPALIRLMLYTSNKVVFSTVDTLYLRWMIANPC
jgi:hypothetical protein